MRILPILLITTTLASATTQAADTAQAQTTPAIPSPAPATALDAATPPSSGTDGVSAQTTSTTGTSEAAASPAAAEPLVAPEKTPAAKPVYTGTSSSTALGAMDLLPLDQAANVARIEGLSTGTKNGKLIAPDRWSVIVRSEKDPNGVHEFEVVSGEIVASHAGSQYVQALKPEDVLPADSIVVDSDQVIHAAEAYAHANKVKLATATYELTKDGPNAAPVWHATVFNQEGEKAGTIVMTASKGVMVSHDGFAKEPAAEAPTSSSAKKSAKPHRRHHREREGGVAHAFKHVGGKLEKFFTGHDTIENGN